MTFDIDEIQNHSIQMPGLNGVEFDIDKIKNAEMSVEFKWEPHSVFRPGQLVRLNGVLCRVIAVGENGTIYFQKENQSK